MKYRITAEAARKTVKDAGGGCLVATPDRSLAAHFAVRERALMFMLTVTTAVFESEDYTEGGPSPYAGLRQEDHGGGSSTVYFPRVVIKED